MSTRRLALYEHDRRRLVTRELVDAIERLIAVHHSSQVVAARLGVEEALVDTVKGRIAEDQANPIENELKECRGVPVQLPGTRWEQGEVDQLRRMVRDGFKTAAIACHLGRSFCSVESKRRTLVRSGEVARRRNRFA